MRTITKERTVTELIGYEAIDGTIFNASVFGENGNEKARKECLEYEKSAKAVIASKVQNFKIGESNEYAMFCGCEDNRIEIFNPKTEQELYELQVYLKSKYSTSKDLFTDERSKRIYRVGNEIIINWNFDEEWFTDDTLETMLGRIKDSYYKSIDDWKNKENNNGQK